MDEKRSEAQRQAAEAKAQKAAADAARAREQAAAAEELAAASDVIPGLKILGYRGDDLRYAAQTVRGHSRRDDRCAHAPRDQGSRSGQHEPAHARRAKSAVTRRAGERRREGHCWHQARRPERAEHRLSLRDQPAAFLPLSRHSRANTANARRRSLRNGALASSIAIHAP